MRCSQSHLCRDHPPDPPAEVRIVLASTNDTAEQRQAWRRLWTLLLQDGRASRTEARKTTAPPVGDTGGAK